MIVAQRNWNICRLDPRPNSSWSKISQNPTKLWTQALFNITVQHQCSTSVLKSARIWSIPRWGVILDNPITKRWLVIDQITMGRQPLIGRWSALSIIPLEHIIDYSGAGLLAPSMRSKLYLTVGPDWQVYYAMYAVPSSPSMDASSNFDIF